jgi:hypothetical protein
MVEIILLLLMRWMDRYEREPLGLVAPIAAPQQLLWTLRRLVIAGCSTLK